MLGQNLAHSRIMMIMAISSHLAHTFYFILGGIRSIHSQFTDGIYTDVSRIVLTTSDTMILMIIISTDNLIHGAVT